MTTPLSSVALVAALLGGATAGCVRADTAADRQVAEMREAMTRMRAEHDRMDERLDALEIALADQRAQDAHAPAPPRVALGASSSKAESKGEVRSQGGRRPEGPNKAKGAYDAALRLVDAKEYDRAADAFAAFLVRWPDHPYAENAMYWRGESYFAKADYDRAAEQFEAVLARFQGGGKTPDALLKLGMCEEHLGATERAKHIYQRLAREYPRSHAARKIPAGPKESR